MSGSFARSRAWPAAAALAAGLAGLCAPAWAGDGSGTDNPALLRGTIGLGSPEQGWSASSTSPASKTVSKAQPGNCAALIAAGVVSADCPGSAHVPPKVATPVKTVPQAAITVPLPPPVAKKPQQQTVDFVPTGTIISPETPGDDAMTGDWSVTLEGSSTWDKRGQRYKATLAPEGSMTFNRPRGDLRLSAGLNLSYQPGNGIAVDGGNAAMTVDNALSRDLVLKAGLTLDGTRDEVNAITSPSNEAVGALSVTGKADLSVEKQVGLSSYLFGASLSRKYVGETGLVGGGTISNDYKSWSGFGLRARASYRLTPILSTYLEAKADRAYYDAIAAGSGARSDNWTYQGTVGLSGKWANGLEATLYGGYGLTQYDSGLLNSGGGYVVGGSLSYPVVHRGQVTASLNTRLTPTDTVAGASTNIVYTANLGGRYLVNDWLTLRSALGGTWSIYPGSTYTETGLTANVGLDWMFGTHTAFLADYTLGADWTPTANGLRHTVSLGLKVSR